MKQRIIYLDIIRVLACLMVICMHAPMAYSDTGETPMSIRVFMVYSSYWTMPCVCLFFAVSGALLLPTPPSECLTWLKKRLKKVIWPTLIWTLFYMIVDAIIKYPELDIYKLGRAVCSIPFNRQGHGILWFMYTLIGLYLVAPVISPWLQNCGKKTLQFYLVLWGVTLCYPVLGAFVEINETPYGILYYFSGFLGYFVLGYYLHTYGLRGRTAWYIGGLCCLMPLMLLYKIFIEARFDLGQEIMWYLGPICPLMLLCWWKICSAIGNRLKNDIVANKLVMVSNLCFGIYLSHIFIMRNCVQQLTVMISNYYLQTLATIVLTIVLTIIISYAISKLPFSNYIIGYQQKK